MAHERKDPNSPAALRREVAALKAKVAAEEKIIDDLKAAKQGSPKHKLTGRAIIIWLSIAAATLLLVLGNIFFWTGHTIVDTDRYVAAVGPLIEKPPIQSAIASYTTTQIFNNVDVQGYVQSALPPRAAFLAPPLTSQLKKETQSSVKSILANPKVQSYWYSSLAKRHEALINYSKSYQGNGTIVVSDIYGQLSTRLESTKLSFLAGKKLPPNVGSIKVATVGWLPALHKLSAHIGLYQILSTLLLFGFSALAIGLSSRRRRTVITLSLCFAAFMLLTLLGTRIAGSIVVAKVAPAYQSAAQVAYNTVLHSFVTQTAGLLLLSLLAGLVAWASGPYRSAEIVKGRLVAFLSGQLHQSVFGTHENALTLWAGKYKRLVQWGSIVLISLIMLLVQLSPKLVAVYGLLMLISVLLVEFLAAPQKK